MTAPDPMSQPASGANEHGTPSGRALRLADDESRAGLDGGGGAVLAMGIGATTAVFTLVNGLMFRPLPVRDPGSLVELLRGTRASRG